MSKKTSVILSIFLFVMILFGSASYINAKEEFYTLPFAVRVNSKGIELKKALLHNNRTYIELREFCDKAGMTVEWVDPKHHQSYAPGGGLPGGINISNPSFVYVKDVTDFENTKNVIKAVDITGIYKRYNKEGNYKYYFSDEGLVVNNGENKVIKLNYNPSNGYMYISVDEFREKIQPYFVDICMQ